MGNLELGGGDISRPDSYQEDDIFELYSYREGDILPEIGELPTKDKLQPLKFSLEIPERKAIDREQSLEMLRAHNVEAWSEWRQKHPDIQLDLSGADLHGRDLRGFDLSGVNLVSANLRETILEKVNL